MGEGLQREDEVREEGKEEDPREFSAELVLVVRAVSFSNGFD